MIKNTKPVSPRKNFINAMLDKSSGNRLPLKFTAETIAKIATRAVKIINNTNSPRLLRTLDKIELTIFCILHNMPKSL